MRHVRSSWAHLAVLAVIKFLDLIKFHDIFWFAYKAPQRKPKLGHYLMVMGILMLLFIGFNRLWHFVCIRLDSFLCGVFRLTRLPAASTFWRYVNRLGINQAHSFLKIMNIIRERVWQLFGESLSCHEILYIGGTWVKWIAPCFYKSFFLNYAKLCTTYIIKPWQ